MTQPDHATLRRFILGQLSRADADALEAAYFADGDLEAALDDAADDLAREYLDGTLDSEARSAFAATLVRPAVAARLAVVQGLRTRTAVAAPLATVTPGPASQRTTSWTALAAAAVLVLAAGAWWFATPDRRTADRAAVQPPPTDAPVAAPPPATRSFVALTLSAAATRSAGATPTVDVPAGIDDVVIGVTTPLTALAGLSADVRALDADRTWRGAVTPAGANAAPGTTASVVVPAQELPSGDYILSLRRGDSTPFRAAFRVIRK